MFPRFPLSYPLCFSMDENERSLHNLRSSEYYKSFDIEYAVFGALWIGFFLIGGVLACYVFPGSIKFICGGFVVFLAIGECLFIKYLCVSIKDFYRIKHEIKTLKSSIHKQNLQ